MRRKQHPDDDAGIIVNIVLVKTQRMTQGPGCHLGQNPYLKIAEDFGCYSTLLRWLQKYPQEYTVCPYKELASDNKASKH